MNIKTSNTTNATAGQRSRPRPTLHETRDFPDNGEFQPRFHSFCHLDLIWYKDTSQVPVIVCEHDVSEIAACMEVLRRLRCESILRALIHEHAPTVTHPGALPSAPGGHARRDPRSCLGRSLGRGCLGRPLPFPGRFGKRSGRKRGRTASRRLAGGPCPFRRSTAAAATQTSATAAARCLSDWPLS